MNSKIAREHVEIAAAMQVKALAFDREHPDNPLGTCSAAAYAKAIQNLVSEQDELVLARLMLEASARAVALLMFSSMGAQRPV
jgi:hypothetical protein